MADYDRDSYDGPTHPSDFIQAKWKPGNPRPEWEIAQEVSRHTMEHREDLMSQLAEEFGLDRRVVKDAMFSLQRDKHLRDKGVRNPSIVVFDDRQLDQFHEAYPSKTFTLEDFGAWMSEGLLDQPRPMFDRASDTARKIGVSPKGFGEARSKGACSPTQCRYCGGKHWNDEHEAFWDSLNRTFTRY